MLDRKRLALIMEIVALIFTGKRRSPRHQMVLQKKLKLPKSNWKSNLHSRMKKHSEAKYLPGVDDEVAEAARMSSSIR